MAPMIDIQNQQDFERTKKYLDLHDVEYTTPKNVNIVPSRESSKSKYIEVPSIGLLVAKEKTFFNYNHQEIQDELHSKNNKILSPYEFIEFGKEVRVQDPKLYKAIFEIAPTWRAEWLDAKFKKKGKDIFIIYHAFENGNLVQKSEKLDKNTLMKDKTPGISIDSLLEYPTNQGMPKKSTQDGNLYYWAPEDGTVARLYACSDWVNFGAWTFPLDRFSVLGVRAAEQLR